ncbi:MAG TPA: cupredoxin domain-containing protein [Acidobacteriaceae bacterium]|jgi:cytochrome c oxidase subunit 2|nr:cupredoxin domain-containing protein [Acidobacteriaceae bacterium]
MKSSGSMLYAKKDRIIMLPKRVFIIAAVILTVMVSPLLSRGYAEAKISIFTIHARRYEFLPSEITLKVGQRVKLIFISDDITHGISVEGLLLDLNIRRNKPTEIEITPSKAGDFEGECSRYCGVGHDRMKFSIHVVN